MSLTINMQDQLSPAIEQLLQNMQPARLHTIIARAAANLTRDHFAELDRDRPNKLGGKRTHFWREASRATTHKADESTAKVVIDHLGAALQYFGGDITPVESTYLTIPASPEAHGKGPREFEDLEYRPYKGPRARGALVLGEEVMYWLVESVHLDPDPDVLPTEQAYAEHILGVLDRNVALYANRDAQGRFRSNKGEG